MSDVIDQPNVQTLVAKVRESLEVGDDKDAARLLTDAIYHTHDPAIEQQVCELALQGRERAGRFSKGRWDEIIRIAELHSKPAAEA
jgi:hypothetical protein